MQEEGIVGFNKHHVTGLHRNRKAGVILVKSDFFGLLLAMAYPVRDGCQAAEPAERGLGEDEEEGGAESAQGEDGDAFQSVSQ